MRGAVLILALVALSGCSGEGALTAWHWNRFLDRPGDKTLEAVLDDIRTCGKPGCPQGENVTAAMIDRLTDRVRAGDMRAVRLAMASPVLIGEGGGRTGDVAHSFGPVIKAKPEAFLDAALVENCHRTDYVTTTPYLMIDDDGAQYGELVARRAALASVSRPYLQPLRDEYLAALDPAIAKADRARFKIPTYSQP
ncbi:MAG: hypothetical protein JF615_04475 [Asticcacaulis sp.]|nr:hypothetical protein [Asticcacaulis sp.]